MPTLPTAILVLNNVFFISSKNYCNHHQSLVPFVIMSVSVFLKQHTLNLAGWLLTTTLT